MNLPLLLLSTLMMHGTAAPHAIVYFPYAYVLGGVCVVAAVLVLWRAARRR